MNTTDATPAADRGSECNALLGPTVPDSVLAYLHAYGDSRADEDGLSGLRIGEAILALRRWAAELQAAERERLKADAETWGNALNDASWAQVDAYRKHMGQVESALFFNNGKSILRDALAAYFKALRA